MCGTASAEHPCALLPHACGILSRLSAAQVSKWTFRPAFCFWVVLCYHLLSISMHHLPQKIFALLRFLAFPTVTLLQKFQTSGHSPGRTCSTISSGHCLDRESLHPVLFLNWSASIQISGFCFVAVQGGPLLLEQTPLTGRNITSSSWTRCPSKMTQKYLLWHLVLCVFFLQYVNAVTAAGTDEKIKHHRMDPR